jgi:hypothetical protein
MATKQFAGVLNKDLHRICILYVALHDMILNHQRRYDGSYKQLDGARLEAMAYYCFKLLAAQRYGGRRRKAR